MKIFFQAGENEVLEEATKKLNDLLEKYKNFPLLLMFSGGSALKLIDGIQGKYITRTTTVTVLDERYSKDEEVNNFAQIKKKGFYDMLTRHEARVIDTRVHHNELQEDLAIRLEAELRTWRREYPKGKIIATLGMGEDGHVAGIIPEKNEVNKFKKLFLSKNWVAFYDAGKKILTPSGSQRL
jgi:6-phosphogluconolactonase/glucosamine-6-phosphate isomerase/deaminase